MGFSCASTYPNPSAPTELSELSDDSDKSEEVKVNRIGDLHFK
jgi:hypothetical protein